MLLEFLKFTSPISTNSVFGVGFWLSFTVSVFMLALLCPIVLYLLLPRSSSINLALDWVRGGTCGVRVRSGICLKGDADEVKIVPNPLRLLRGAEQRNFSIEQDTPTITTYDMTLSIKDHKALFAHDPDCGGDRQLRIANAAIKTIRDVHDPFHRMKVARSAIESRDKCVEAWIILGNESADCVEVSAECMLNAAEAAEKQLRKSKPAIFAHPEKYCSDFWIKPETRPYVYSRYRFGYCLCKFGKWKEAALIFQDLLKFPAVEESHLNIQSCLLYCLLKLKLYDDVKVTLEKYRFIPSAVRYYTLALLEIRDYLLATENLQAPETPYLYNKLIRSGIIQTAIEFNPHVPQYLVFAKVISFPPEHFCLRGDSEAVAYAFDHVEVWADVENAVSVFESIYLKVKPELYKILRTGVNFEKYSTHLCIVERELLTYDHEQSVWPPTSLWYFLTVSSALSIIFVALFILALSCF